MLTRFACWALVDLPCSDLLMEYELTKQQSVVDEMKPYLEVWVSGGGQRAGQ